MKVGLPARLWRAIAERAEEKVSLLMYLRTARRSVPTSGDEVGRHRRGRRIEDLAVLFCGDYKEASLRSEKDLKWYEKQEAKQSRLRKTE